MRVSLLAGLLMVALPVVHTAAAIAAQSKPAAVSASSAATPGDAMAKVVESYLAIHQALGNDTQDGVKASAEAIAKAAPPQMAKLKQNATELAQAKDLKQMRSKFRALSAPMVQWVKDTHPAGLEIYHCSMAQGGRWVQRAGDVVNPYYGKDMAGCGEKES